MRWGGGGGGGGDWALLLDLFDSWLSGVAVACQRCRASDPGSLAGLASGR